MALFAGLVGGVAASLAGPAEVGFWGGALFGIGVSCGMSITDALVHDVGLSCFAGLVAGWALLALAGIPLTFGTSVLIGLVMIPSALLVACFCPCIVPTIGQGQYQ